MANCWPEEQGQMFFLQWNPRLGEMLDQVCFAFKGICQKVEKYDRNIICLTESVYELSE